MTARIQIDGIVEAEIDRQKMRTCATPMIVETKPMIEPTERSMWRMTMTSTMPVAMTAIEEVWTLQVPEIARRQEQALAGLDLRVDVEPDPDQQQRADHAEHARVDLGGAQQPAKRRFVRSGAGRAGRCGGHGLSLLLIFARRRARRSASAV